MYIKQIHIDAFGGVRNLTLDFSRSLNIIEGKNESGKSSVSMFIKFVFYGLSGRGVDGAVSERKKYVNFETGSANGYIILEKNGEEYRVSRELYVSDAGEKGGEAVRERVSIINEATGEKQFAGEVPGIALLGMPEKMFVNSVFVRQMSDGVIDGNGMSEAIENILYSGDESLSCRRATERLEKIRKTLLHKNGSGGEIYEKRRSVVRLEGELEEAKAKNLEIMEMEDAIAESERLIVQRTLRAKELSDIVSAYDKFERLKKLNELEALESEKMRLGLVIETYPPLGELEDAIEEIRRVSNERNEALLKHKNVKMRISALDNSLPPLMTEEEKEAELRDIRDAKKAKASKTGSFVVSLIMFILATVCAVGGVLLRSMLDKTVAYIALGAAVIMLVIGITTLVRSLTSLKRFNRLLDKWMAVDIEDMERIRKEKIEAIESQRSENSEYGALLREELAVSEYSDGIVSRLRILASRFAEENTDTDTMVENAVSRAAMQRKELLSFQREYDTLSGKLSVLGDKSDEERARIREEAENAKNSESGNTAAGLNKAEYDKTVRDKGFFLSTAEVQKKRHIELEKKLALALASYTAPSEISERLENVKCELKADEKKLAAISLAYDAINQASENIRASLLPRIVSEAGAFMGEFTSGKYNTLGVDRDFNLSYSPNGYMRESDYMSQGTRDAAYISLRIALMKVLFPGNTPMAVYDESFARIDEIRLGKLLNILQGAGEEFTQSIVFTCRTLEAALAGKDVNVIKL